MSENPFSALTAGSLEITPSPVHGASSNTRSKPVMKGKMRVITLTTDVLYVSCVVSGGYTETAQSPVQGASSNSRSKPSQKENMLVVIRRYRGVWIH